MKVGVVAWNFEVFSRLIRKLGIQREDAVHFSGPLVGRGRVFDRVIFTCGYAVVHPLTQEMARTTLRGGAHVEYISCCDKEHPDPEG